MDAKYGLAVVGQAIVLAERRLGSPGGDAGLLENAASAPEVQIMLVGRTAALRGIASLIEFEGVVLISLSTHQMHDGWEMVDLIINPAHVISAQPVLVPS